MTDETINDSPEAPTPDADALEAEPATFDAAYVKSLRSEAAARRREAKEGQERITAMEVELRELREDRFRRSLVDANAASAGWHRLVDIDDLLVYGDRTALVDEAGRPDPARIEAAIADLIAKRPHLAAPVPTITRGVQPGPRPAQPSLGAMLGRAARGESG